MMLLKTNRHINIMRYAHALAAGLIALTFSACKKQAGTTLSNSWQYKSNTYTVAKTERSIGFGTDILNAYSDTVNVFTRKGLSLTFTTFPTVSATYKVVGYPMADDEVSIYAWDNAGNASQYYSDDQAPGGVRVFVMNGRMTISIVSVWMREARFTDPDSTVLYTSYTEK